MTKAYSSLLYPVICYIPVELHSLLLPLLILTMYLFVKVCIYLKVFINLLSRVEDTVGNRTIFLKNTFLHSQES